MTFFAGLAEDDSTAGNFLYRESPWPTFTDSWGGCIQGFAEWENALILYQARNGCELLVRPSGEVGWWMMQERYVADYALDFDEFVSKFSKYREVAWPFDPYGPN